jgi:hypothetical protein
MDNDIYSNIIGTGILSKKLLCSEKCFIVDCKNEIYLWIGNNTRQDDKSAANDLLAVLSINIAYYCINESTGMVSSP